MPTASRSMLIPFSGFTFLIFCSISSSSPSTGESVLYHLLHVSLPENTPHLINVIPVYLDLKAHMA